MMHGEQFCAYFRAVQEKVHQTAVEHGFWDHAYGVDEYLLKSNKIALMHSELSECLEAVRKPHLPDSHLPDFNPEALELADTVIRIMDYATRFGLDVAGAIIAKGNYNEGRPHKHGKVM